jgi:hypothetical protein
MSATETIEIDPEQQENNLKEDYMLKIKDRISEFRDELESDTMAIDYQTPVRLMAKQLSESNPVFKVPHYLDHSWRQSELIK